MRRQIAFFPQVLLVGEAIALFLRVVELAESIGDFHSPDVELEAFDKVGSSGFCFESGETSSG